MTGTTGPAMTSASDEPELTNPGRHAPARMPNQADMRATDGTSTIPARCRSEAGPRGADQPPDRPVRNIPRAATAEPIPRPSAAEPRCEDPPDGAMSTYPPRFQEAKAPAAALLMPRSRCISAGSRCIRSARNRSLQRRPGKPMAGLSSDTRGSASGAACPTRPLSEDRPAITPSAVTGYRLAAAAGAEALPPPNGRPGVHFHGLRRQRPRITSSHVSLEGQRRRDGAQHRHIARLDRAAERPLVGVDHLTRPSSSYERSISAG